MSVAAARSAPDLKSRRDRPALAGELLVIGLLVFVYDRIRGFSGQRSDLALSNGHHVLSLESLFHIDVELALNTALSHHQGWEYVASWYYQVMHLSAALLVLLWCYLRHPGLYRPARNALLVINAVGLVVFWSFPVAPPRLLTGSGFVDSAVLSGVADKTTIVTPDLYGAMPSLHLAWATWVAAVVFGMTADRTVRALGVIHVAVTSLVVTATANHYVLDLVAGVVLALAALRLCVDSATLFGSSPSADRSTSRPSQAAVGAPAGDAG